MKSTLATIIVSVLVFLFPVAVAAWWRLTGQMISAPMLLYPFAGAAAVVWLWNARIKRSMRPFYSFATLVLLALGTFAVLAESVFFAPGILGVKDYYLM